MDLLRPLGSVFDITLIKTDQVSLELGVNDNHIRNVRGNPDLQKSESP